MAILEKNGLSGKVLGIDRDPTIIKNLELKNRLILVNDSYANLKKITERYNFKPDGILFDLGMSSWHLEESKRGFSFQKDEPLDMRYSDVIDFSRSLKIHYQETAEKIVNTWSEEKIEEILREYGGERFAKRIAKRICEIRKVKPIKTTFQLKEIIRRAFPKRYKFGKIHFATRTFQALRIAVNQELENLKIVLPQALDILEPSGRLVVISFHSGEDRIVKNFFRDQAKQGLLRILTKKPVEPSEEEVRINPRSRSAKLRAVIKF